MRIDRGPSSVPEKGIPYLSKEGYPYRVFETAHPDVVKVAAKLDAADAIQSIVEAAGSIPAKKFVSMFKQCLSPEERETLATKKHKKHKAD
jgi:hypothetical protein